MNKPRILFSIPRITHIEIALDELEGMQELGYACGQFPYAAQEGVESRFGRLKVIVQNALNLVKTARRFKPDIIYINSRIEVLAGIRDYITLSILRTLYSSKVRVLIKSHGSDLDVFENKSFFISKVVLPYLKKHVAGWLLLSSEEKSIVVNNGYLDSDKTFVAKNIVRTHQFNPNPQFRARLNIPEDHTILLFSGRVIKEKGIYDVIEAFAEIKDQYKATLIVVGSGTDLEAIKKISQELSISDRVLFIGFIPEQSVVEFYANSDVLVFPTYFPEGFAMALFNAVAAGLRIITTPTRAAVDYLSDPDNCLWVKPQDSRSVAQALHTLLGSESLMKSMQQNNLQKGLEFSKSQVAKEIEATIKAVIFS